MEIQELNSKALTVVDELKSIATITNNNEYLRCGELWKVGKAMLKTIDDGYDSIITSLHKAHKEAVAKKKSFYDPVESATKWVKGLMISYETEQERIRLVEEARLRKIAEEAEAKRLEEERKAEEERLLNEAIAAEAAGDTKVAEAILEAPMAPPEPVFTPAPIVPKSTPKISGVSYRTVWDFEVTEPDKIPRSFMIPDLVKIRKVVTATKDQSNIPGIRAFSRRV